MQVKVSERRKTLGLTQAELARMAGIGQHTVSDIETGLHVPKVDVAIMIAHVLGVTVEELFIIDDDHAYPR